MKNGETVAAFEREFAAYVGAKHAIACTNGTTTLEVALRVHMTHPGASVVTSPLTMAATTLAILNAGGVPVYHDVDPDTWLLTLKGEYATYLPVSLYGLHVDWCGGCDIDDAAQTLRPMSKAAFVSYSLQRTKILSTHEGGVLCTNRDDLAAEARSVASLGYNLSASSSRIDTNAIRSPNAIRHVRLGQNSRMNDATAALGLHQLERADDLKADRVVAGCVYKMAVAGCWWITPQAIPEGAKHDMWSFAVTVDTPERWEPLAQAIVKHGGKRPYAAWLPSYLEPALRHLASPGTCPIAEDLQRRIMAFQTHSVASAERNAGALRKAIQEVGE